VPYAEATHMKMLPETIAIGVSKRRKPIMAFAPKGRQPVE
jgi:hypothetical protein